MDTLTKIFYLLDQNNKSQSDLAEYLGVGKQLLTNWKSGLNTSYKKYIDKIADYFNVSTDYLLGKTEVKEKPIALTGDELNKELIELYYNLPPDLQEQALRHLRFLVSEKDAGKK